MSGGIPDNRIYDPQYSGRPLNHCREPRQAVHPAAQHMEDKLAEWCADNGYAMRIIGGDDIAVTITRNSLTQVFRADRRHDAITLATTWALAKGSDE